MTMILETVYEVKSHDLSAKGKGARAIVYTLGFTTDPKKARAYYKKRGWSLRHNYSKPFIRITKIKKEKKRKMRG